jgi:hypothetical protein
MDAYGEGRVGRVVLERAEGGVDCILKDPFFKPENEVF